MKVVNTYRGDLALLALSGELNSDSVGRLNEAVATAFNEQKRDFVIEVSEVTSVDSAGLQALSDLQRQCEEQLGMLRVCNADATLRKILEMTRLDRRVNQNRTLEEAVEELAPGMPVADLRSELEL